MKSEVDKTNNNNEISDDDDVVDINNISNDYIEIKDKSALIKPIALKELENKYNHSKNTGGIVDSELYSSILKYLGVITKDNIEEIRKLFEAKKDENSSYFDQNCYLKKAFEILFESNFEEFKIRYKDQILFSFITFLEKVKENLNLMIIFELSTSEIDNKIKKCNEYIKKYFEDLKEFGKKIKNHKRNRKRNKAIKKKIESQGLNYAEYVNARINKKPTPKLSEMLSHKDNNDNH